MSEPEAIAFFVARTADAARRMPLPDALQFLFGALLIAEGHPAVHDLRSAYMNMRDGDALLEILGTGQLKLNLGGDGQ